MKRKGLSPIIATILLISIMFVLAIIIFAAFRGLVSERAQKFGEPIENSCSEVFFDAEAFSDEGKIYVVNKGNVPIYAIKVRKKGFGSLEDVPLKLPEGATTVLEGETDSFVIPNEINIDTGDELVIIPVILGEVGVETKSYVCEEEFGEEVDVSA